MSAISTFDSFVTRLRSGDNDAAIAVWNRFHRRLTGLANKRLDASIRQKVDPDDVVQSACKSFFNCCRNGHYDLNDWNCIWLLLARITLRKCRKQLRHFRAQQRLVERETSLSELTNHIDDGLSCLQPSPSHHAMVHELLETVFNELSARDRQIVSLNLERCSVAEISVRTGCTERTVQRVMQRIRTQLETILAEQ